MRWSIWTSCCDMRPQDCNCGALREAERLHNKKVHRSNRLMCLIGAVENRINQIDEHDPMAHELWERHTNLFRAFLNHRQINYKGN